ncbi:early nodulin-like protein 2 [Actinidia rufa]|uniref:Early nodulin-like protein 2 n=1 Tax=Actinidia rufa TaxID=165716 RepID=A0A7J0GQ51_9ERIC|nr:early nodulin-like protein 2 [Actinidia rufa]
MLSGAPPETAVKPPTPPSISSSALAAIASSSSSSLLPTFPSPSGTSSPTMITPLWGLGFTKMWAVWIGSVQSHRSSVSISRKLHGAGLVNLARKVLWKEFEKSRRVTLSNCYDDWLSDDQIQYACVDAFISYKIRRCLMAGNCQDYDDELLTLLTVVSVTTDEEEWT